MKYTRISLKGFILLLFLITFCGNIKTFAQNGSTEYFERGKSLHKSGNLAKAIEYYSYALSIQKDCEKCFFNRGLAYLELEKYHKSRSDFDKVLMINPADVDAYAQRGGLLYLLGETTAAISDYNFVITAKPSSTMYINRGMAYLELLNYYNALQDLETAITIDKNDPETYRVIGDVYFAKNDPEQAIEYYSKALEIDPDNEKTLNNRGNTYHQLGLESLALKDYDHAIAVYKNSYTYTNRANYWLKKGSYDKALQDCREASRLDFNNAEAYYYIGLIENARGNAQSALSNFNKAIAIHDNRAYFYNGRGIALFELNDFEDAREDFEQALVLNPADAAAKDRIMDCHQQLKTNSSSQFNFNSREEEVFAARGVENYNFTKQSDIKVSEWSNNRDIDQLAKREKEDFGISIYDAPKDSEQEKAFETSQQLKAQKYMELGDFYFVAKDYIEALQHYESALWEDKFLKTAPLKKAKCLIALEQHEDALSALDQYILLNPESPDAYHERGVIRFKTGNIFGARKDYDHGLSLNQQHENLRLSSAKWYASKGFYLKAIDDYSAILKTYPSNKTYYLRGQMWFELKLYNKAITDYTQAILTSDVDKYYYYFARAQAFQFNKESARAIYDYNKTIALSPRFAKAYIYRAAAKSTMGDQVGSCDDYDMAIDLGYEVKGNVEFISHCK